MTISVESLTYKQRSPVCVDMPRPIPSFDDPDECTHAELQPQTGDVISDVTLVLGLISGPTCPRCRRPQVSLFGKGRYALVAAAGEG